MNHLLGTRDFGLDDLLTVLDGAAAGIDACHAKGVVHRDVKPHNIMVERATGRGLLTDFGIARAADFSAFTRPGAVFGTLGYMAPEALRGERSTARSDVFSLGCVAYQALTSEMPRAAAVPDAAVVPPTRRDRRLPAAVDGVLMRALSQEPRERHGSARALVAELRSAVRPATQPAPEPRPVPRRTAPTKVFRTRTTVRDTQPRTTSTHDTGSSSVPHGAAVAMLAVAVFVLTPILILVIRQLAN
jgi:serine/threonine-protein kinase